MDKLKKPVKFQYKDKTTKIIKNSFRDYIIQTQLNLQLANFNHYRAVLISEGGDVTELRAIVNTWYHISDEYDYLYKWYQLNGRMLELIDSEYLDEIVIDKINYYISRINKLKS